MIVGLGNIGDEYKNTRHNIGFIVLDALAKASNICFETKRYASVCQLKHKGRTLVLIKPSTYMNLSGKAVNYWLQKEKIPVSNMFVIVDDLSLPFGTLRIKYKGGSAGHNGLSNIEQILGNSKYNRMRFGIDNKFKTGNQTNYVLGEWTIEEKEILDEKIEKMVKAIQGFATIGIERTMNYFNGK